MNLFTFLNFCFIKAHCYNLPSQVIRARVKDLMIPRYKIVVLVHIGQLTGQSMQISSRCLWDASNDTFASYSFKNSSLYGVATVFAVYFEWITTIAYNLINTQDSICICLAFITVTNGFLLFFYVVYFANHKNDKTLQRTCNLLN